MGQQGNILFGSLSASGGGGVTALQEKSGIEVDLVSAGVYSIENRLNWFFVQQFGAKGDGSTDDTAAIQATVNAAAAGGKPGAVIYFAPGTYKVSGTVTVPAGFPLWIFGCGDGDTTQIVQVADADVFD